MPEAAPALVEIVFLALVFFTIALAFSANKITQALLGPIVSVLESIPIIGGKLAAPLKATGQAVANACGALISKCEALVGSSFHVLARLMDWLWKQTVGEAAALLHVAKLVGNGIYSVSGLRAAVHRLERVWHGIEHGVKSLERRWHGIEHRVHRLEHELAAGIGNDVRVEVGKLDRELHRLRTRVIPKIESEAQAAEADVAALGKYVRDHYLANTEAELEAAVAIGLAALGLGGLRCNSNPWKNNKSACGLWGDLSDLLGLALALGVALDFETFVRDAQAATEATVGAVESFVGLG
jgi:hypothetical protein